MKKVQIAILEVLIRDYPFVKNYKIARAYRYCISCMRMFRFLELNYGKDKGTYYIYTPLKTLRVMLHKMKRGVKK